MVRITMEDGGVIDIELDKQSAPITCENFEKLVKSGFYDGLTFHRVIPGFMIQGGCPLGNGTGGPGWNQFFIMHKDAPHLDGQYAAFGKVVAGMDVVDRIAAVRTDWNDKPATPVRMKSVVLIDE